MTPDPFLRNVAIALAMVLMVTGLFGLSVVTAAGTVLNVVVWSALRASYSKARRRWSIEDAYASAQFAEEEQAVAPALAERGRLDRLVDASALAVIAAGLLGLSAGLVLGIEPPGRLAGHAAGVAALIGTGGVFWSSLIDWYWVLPRISGLTGHRACRPEPEPGAEFVSWEEVTRWWIIHRMAAALAVAVSAGGIIGTLAGLGAKSLDATPAVQGMTAVLTAVVATFAEVYRKKAADGLPLLLHPEIVVGESYTDKIAGVGYPVDVSMEGFKLVRREDQHDRYIAHRTKGTTKWLRAKGDETVRLADAQSRRVGSGDLSCSECIGMNWYCVRNPNAWDKGPVRGSSAPGPEAS